MAKKSTTIHPDQIDSYDLFTRTFNITKADFFKFGIESTIYPHRDKVLEQWDDLKRRIASNEVVHIRGYGRDATGTPLVTGLCSHLFGNENIRKDRTNNQMPQTIVAQLTNKKRDIDLLNYQVSHIFGHTKTPYLFEAGWNIAFVPKMIDPLTGHETMGDWPKEFLSRPVIGCHFKKGKP